MSAFSRTHGLSPCRAPCVRISRTLHDYISVLFTRFPSPSVALVGFSRASFMIHSFSIRMPTHSNASSGPETVAGRPAGRQNSGGGVWGGGWRGAVVRRGNGLAAPCRPRGVGGRRVASGSVARPAHFGCRLVQSERQPDAVVNAAASAQRAPLPRPLSLCRHCHN